MKKATLKLKVFQPTHFVTGDQFFLPHGLEFGHYVEKRPDIPAADVAPAAAELSEKWGIGGSVYQNYNGRLFYLLDCEVIEASGN